MLLLLGIELGCFVKKGAVVLGTTVGRVGCGFIVGKGDSVDGNTTVVGTFVVVVNDGTTLGAAGLGRFEMVLVGTLVTSTP